MITRKMWYEWIAKSTGRDPKCSKFYQINEIEDSTTYELQLSDNKKFIFNKKNKVVMFGRNKNYVYFDLSDLKKIFNFAKKNGAI